MGKKRPIRIDGAVCYVPLTQGKIAIIDSLDAYLVRDHDWYAIKNSGNWYAGRSVGTRTVLLHHVVAPRPPTGYETDHKDGDGLNDRRGNLRDATKGENMRSRHKSINRTGMKGVAYIPKLGKFFASLHVDKRRIALGYYATAEEAGAAYDAGALRHFGQFAVTNKAMGRL